MNDSVFALESTGISADDAKEILREFHEVIMLYVRSLGKGSTAVVRGLRFQRTNESSMSPVHMLRSAALFAEQSTCDDPSMNLDLQLIAETFYEILIHHQALGGGWIKITAVQPFSIGDGWLLYESSPSLV